MKHTGFFTGLRKAYISFRLYGFGRTYIKLFGRTRSRFLPRLPIAIIPKKKIVGIIGCGQFATSTIAFFLRKRKGNIIAACYDVDQEKASSFSFYFRCRHCPTVDALLEMDTIRIVYIASNHASHTDYAIQALSRSMIVHVEKPLSTTFEQFQRLLSAIRQNPSARIYIGYNRPYAPTTKFLISHLKTLTGPLSLNCFITGHLIPADHWYRHPAEGTRICGNLGHWIDLTIHLLWAKPVQPRKFEVTFSVSNETERDDNVCITMVSDRCDLIVLTLSSRGEPFEGINETINCQCEEVICKIDDFRRVTLWQGNHFYKKKYFRKNVGHEESVFQPFSTNNRNWAEVEISTRLMLMIADMTYKKETHRTFTV